MCGNLAGDHVDFVTLRRYLRHEIGQPHAAAIARHVERCGPCGQALGRMCDEVAPPHDDVGDGARFVIVSLLGRGGMGDVFRAHDLALERDVALKRLRSLEPTGRDFEARALARVRHRNVVAIHDVVDFEGSTSLIMELVEGGTLDERLSAMRGFEVTRVFLDLADGLATVNEAGVTHGDLKPENVLWHEAERCPKLADFGLAHLGATDCDGARHRFTAPEVVSGGPPSSLADQWALAAMWSEAYRRSRAGTTPRALRSVLGRARAERPEDRFGSVRELRVAARAAIRRRRFQGLFAAALLVLVLVLARSFSVAAAHSRCVAELASAPPEWSLHGLQGARIDAARRTISTWRQGIQQAAGEACEVEPVRPIERACFSAQAKLVDHLSRQLASTADQVLRDEALARVRGLNARHCRTEAELRAYVDERGEVLPDAALEAVWSRIWRPTALDTTELTRHVAELEALGLSEALFQSLVELRYILDRRGLIDRAREANERSCHVALGLGNLVFYRRCLLLEAEYALFTDHDAAHAQQRLARIRAIRAPISSQDHQRLGRLESNLDFVVGDFEAMEAHAIASLVRLMSAGMETYLARVDLMIARYELGDAETVLALAESLIAERSVTTGRRHSRIAGLLRYAALALARLGDLDRAHALASEATLIRSQLLGTTHVETAFTELALAHVERLRGRSDEALARALRALDVLNAGLPFGHFEHRRQSLVVAELALASGDEVTARDVLVGADALGDLDALPPHSAWRLRTDALHDALEAATAKSGTAETAETGARLNRRD